MSDQPHALTPREKQIVALLCQELSYKLIAQRLGISKGTVKRHIANARTKMGVCTNIGLALAFISTIEPIVQLRGR
jgi:DNA-binding CsgD family transcriptional regulator